MKKVFNVYAKDALKKRVSASSRDLAQTALSSEQSPGKTYSIISFPTLIVLTTFSPAARMLWYKT